ncbi:MAG: NAD-dependent epimerase/dehydratase family protein [Nannocystaceae bacterium]|nr:NAD-dependent epimerase/dehydratase family protein [Nannocystaceae bacterium]
MRLFVTGASGFIGGHVVEALRGRHEISALARSDAAAREVESFGARPVRAALGEVSPATLERVDAIVHCAARAEDWGTRAQFWDVNVEGTRQLLEAARAASVPRFIHLGTEAALFTGRDLVDVDETFPYPQRHRFLYCETKAEAERLVLAANRDGMTTISLRPRLVWGPRDKTILPSLLDTVRRGGFAWIDGGRHSTSTVHVANVVAGVERALEHGRGGEAYFLADDERSSIRDFLTRLVATAGVTLPERALPGAIARGAAAVVEGLWRVVRPGRRPPLSRLAAAMMSCTVTVVTDKAKRELGWSPVITVADGLAAMSASARATP